MLKNILVTGGAGFIGSNFLHFMVNKYPDYRFINLDLLTYAGNLENLTTIERRSNYKFVKGDITDQNLVDKLVKEKVDCIVNFAAETHVDRSIQDPQKFLQTNVLGTQVLLEAAKKYQIKKYIQISTDEVYGSLNSTGCFTEETPLAPNNPYSASKAGADHLVRAYYQTFGLPINITRCSNNYGPYQFPEKLIPLFVTNALENKKLPLYGDGQHIRDWIYVEDHCRAIDLVIHQGKNGQIYNIAGDNQLTNYQVTKTILEVLKKPTSLIQYTKDRLGHDRRYALDSEKLQQELGWRLEESFASGIKKTILWYVQHEDWWRRIKDGDYRDYYQNMYLDR